MSMSNRSIKEQVYKLTKTDKPRKSRGFTLAELLVVVAIVGVLTAISIPIFTSQLEKSRRATDMANARNILSILKTGYMCGDIEFTTDNAGAGVYGCACVTVAVGIDGMQICASNNVKVLGSTDISQSQRIGNYIKSFGLGDLRVKSRTIEDKGGWDFYTVILYSDGRSRIASGTLKDNQVGAWGVIDGRFENNANNWRTSSELKGLSTIEMAMSKN